MKRMTIEKDFHIWSGPRGLGKTEKARELLKDWQGTVLHKSADLLVPPDGSWLRSCFRESREIAALDKPVLLVLDEVQRIAGWERIVEEETRSEGHEERSVKVLVISSSALPAHLQKPSSYFAPLRFSEAADRYGFTLKEYLYYGGHPVALRKLTQSGERDVDAWRDFVAGSHLETVLGRDLPTRTPVTKPLVFRQVLSSCLRHAGEVFSVNRISEEVPDRPHAKTVAGYLDLLQEAHLIRVLEKFSTEEADKSSIPCLIALDNALVTATSGKSFEEYAASDEAWRLLAKNAVGARLFALTRGMGIELFHWKDRDKEVDFVLSDGRETVAIELRKGFGQRDHGLKTFLGRFPGARSLSVSLAENSGRMIPLARFLEMTLEEILQSEIFRR